MTNSFKGWPVIVIAGLAIALLLGDGTPAWAMATDTSVKGVMSPGIQTEAVGGVEVARAPGDPLPPGGVDLIEGTGGEIHMEAMEGNQYLPPGMYFMNILEGPPNLTEVVRMDPVCDPLGTIDMEMTQLELIASDGINEVMVHINPRMISTGQAVEQSAGTECTFPTDSFFDVFTEIDLPGLVVGLTHNEPISLYSPDNESMPPYGSSYTTLLGFEGVQLYEAGIETGLWIRYVRHDLPPIEECEPDPLNNYLTCTQVDCSLLGFPPDWECVPTRINWDPTTFEYFIVECQCLEPGYCHVEPDQTGGGPPYCVGDCPAPLVCVQYEQDMGDGRFESWCQCEDQPEVCEPTGLQDDCKQVDCAALGYPATYECLPKQINWDPVNLAYSVIACECQDPEFCHVEPSTFAGQPPICVGPCPSALEECVQYQQDPGDGTFNYWCQCDPIQDDCDITPDHKACDGYCPPTEPECKPTRLLRGTDGSWVVEECMCKNPDDGCWLGYDEAEDRVWCEGVCPPGEVCTLMSRGAAQGYIEFWCECHDPDNPPPCGPQGDPAFVCEGACPPDTACVAAEFTWDPDQNRYIVTECQCVGFNDCRGYTSLLAPPICQGDCPPGTPDCVQVQPTVGTFRCECQAPYTEACCFTQDGSCQDLDPIVCQTLGGMPQGPGTACAGVVSACCLQDGTCLMADQFCCNQFGGTIYAGASCTQIEACCFDDGSCKDLDPLCCQDQDGIPQGAGTACVDTVIACCLPDGTCVDTDPICCDDLGGVPSGAGACLGDGDMNGIDDACEECYPADTFIGCQEDFCPPGYDCKPVHVRRDGPGAWVIEACECVNPEEDCWIGYDAAQDNVWCEGACPPGEVCTLMSRGAAQGYIEFWCECHPEGEPPPCGPQGDPAFVCEGACPPDTACVAAEFTWDPDLDRFIVTECQCVGFDDCRGYTSLLVPPNCQGDCPPDKPDCVRVQPTAGTFLCECQAPYVEACCFPDGTCADVNPIDCENMGGMAQGPGTACAGVIVACCLADGTCLMADEFCCEQFGGTSYPGASCSEIEACCFEDGSCKDLDPLCCYDQDGIPQGAGTACVDMVVACCFEDGSCLETDPLCCDELGGVLSGEGNCLGDNDLNGIDDACEDCFPAVTHAGCEEVFCPPGYECLPSRVTRWPDGTWVLEACECVKRSEDCWIGYSAAEDAVWCEGVCPDPEVCTLMSVGAASGYIEFWCECHPPDNPPPCEPAGDPPFVCQGACPPGTGCVPVKFEYSTSAQRFIVTDCECLGYDDCRGYTSLLAPPDCDGWCPPGEDCFLVEEDSDGDLVPDTFWCECQDACIPTADALNCEPVLCPDPVEVCLPKRIRGPSLSFPPGGIDTIVGTTGEIEVVGPTGEPIVFTIDPDPATNLTVVSRSDPLGGGGGGGATIDMEMLDINFDSNDGMLKVYHGSGLNTTVGQVQGFSDGQDYPAESFFDVYVNVDIVGFAEGMLNLDPIRIEGGGIYSLPPWGVSYETPPGMMDVPLFFSDGLPSNFWIRRVLHILPPPPPPFEVIDCDCMNRDHCHIQFSTSPGVPPWCEGGCPEGFVCEREQFPDATGWTEYWCDCNCYCGDIDHSGGPIDLADFATFALCYGLSGPNPPGCDAAAFKCSDMDDNGTVNLADFATFATWYGLTTTQAVPNCQQP